MVRVVTAAAAAAAENIPATKTQQKDGGHMEQLLEKLPYWDALNQNEREMVRQAAIIRKYKPGFVLHGNSDAGNSCLGMIYVISGGVRAFVVSNEGREITLFFLEPTATCVLSASCLISQIHFETQLVVTKESEILVIPASVFGKLTQYNIHVRCFMYELSTQRFSDFMWVVEQMLFQRFDQRLASFFLVQYEKNGIPEVRMTQEQIAQNINSAREVVARTLKQFSTDGLIEVKRGRIILKQLDGLKKLLRNP